MVQVEHENLAKFAGQQIVVPIVPPIEVEVLIPAGLRSIGHLDEIPHLYDAVAQPRFDLILQPTDRSEQPPQIVIGHEVGEVADDVHPKRSAVPLADHSAISELGIVLQGRGLPLAAWFRQRPTHELGVVVNDGVAADIEIRPHAGRAADRPSPTRRALAPMLMPFSSWS